jgi:hypothetical protein
VHGSNLQLTSSIPTCSDKSCLSTRTRASAAHLGRTLSISFCRGCGLTQIETLRAFVQNDRIPISARISRWGLHGTKRDRWPMRIPLKDEEKSEPTKFLPAAIKSCFSDHLQLNLCTRRLCTTRISTEKLAVLSAKETWSIAHITFAPS